MTESSTPSLKSLGSFQRRAVTATSENLVRFGSLPIGELPLLAEPAAPGVSLASWAAANRPLLEEKLQKHGGILFRGFDLRELEDLEIVIRAVSGESLEYRERSSGNLRRGMARASAVLILNDLETGRPEAVLESSPISARRTAALGARTLLAGKPPGRVGLIGAGLINSEITRFLISLCERSAS